MLNKKINVALVGLRFGGAFVDIYRDHPDIANIKVFDLDKALCEAFIKRGSADGAYNSFEEILNDPACDAVHLVTPIPLHAQQTLDVLNAGKHCACTVPMATSIEDLYKIAQAKKASGKNYMMMETTLYTYQFFYVKNMIETGELGKIQFFRGSHYQDLKYWPEYWMGLPPMWYGTHAIGPMVALSGGRIARVMGFGSGTMDPAMHARYGNPYPMESALFEFENGLKGEATRSLFECARPYQEGLFVYGSKKCFEWGYADGDMPYVSELVDVKQFDGRGQISKTTVIKDLPNPYQYLPAEIQRHTIGSDFDPLNPHQTLKCGSGGGHHGSHPHLVHEFVRSIIEEREPWINVELAANITGAGICAHTSAMNNGCSVVVPHIR